VNKRVATMRKVFVLDMDGNDDGVVKMINGPTESVGTVLVFVNSHHCDVLRWCGTLKRHDWRLRRVPPPDEEGVDVEEGTRRMKEHTTQPLPPLNIKPQLT